MTVTEVSPVILSILGAVLLTTLIILTIKLIFTVNKIDKLVDNISGKVTALDGFFNVVGIIDGKFNIIAEKIVEVVGLLINKIFKRKDEDNNE